MNPTAQALLSASASFFAVTIIFAIVYLLCKKAKHPQTQTRTTPAPAPAPSGGLTSITISESASFDPSLNRISMQELLIATRNFSTDGIIGDGSFGYVYKARLNNGVTVAVKKLSKDAFQGFREFRAEMETLGKNKIRHKNLVRILGYCVSGDERMLIYEFIEKGNLDQWIHDTSLDGAMSRCGSGSVSVSVSNKSRSFSIVPLKWDIRVKIIKGVARGLFFLHTLDTPIIHRDIKASNVLLDSDFEAHIADFGLARQVQLSHSHVSTQVAGTMGYMPPEYKNGVTAATVKADVYSFGILMIEVAAGRRPNWPIKVEDGTEVGFVEWAKRKVELGKEIEMIDSTISRENLREAEVREFIRIAACCTSERPRDRPFMVEVVRLLNQL